MNLQSDRVHEICCIFPKELRAAILNRNLDFTYLQEIRLRINRPVILLYKNRETAMEDFVVSQSNIRETMEYVSNYSLYAYEEEIKNGFITINGGHRIGISGKTIVENNSVKTIKYVSSINVRLSHQVKGCADKVAGFVCEEGTPQHTLIISPPGCGKTTLLRDLIRQLSDGNIELGIRGINVAVVDERSEIGACYLGVPQNDLGKRTDILDCCPKDSGMIMLLRSMSPKIIAVDEIGKSSDIDSIEYIINCGCTVIGTVHGSSVEDIKSKPVLKRLMEEGIFKRFIVLSAKSGVGTIEEMKKSM